MNDIIKALQIEVYRLDWKIGEAANDLKRDLQSDGNIRQFGNIEWYNSAINKRTDILECIKKLSSL
jgi:hypothetical protein